MNTIKYVHDKLLDNITKKVVGKQDTITKAIVTLLCKGHLLLDDVPGTAKTTLAKSIAQSIGCTFKRVQCTPDLLPSDVTGIYYYNQKTGEFILRKGSVFTDILLADEINRSTPRTQSSLLECMEERQVSIDGNTYSLSETFYVIATQNPIESFGMYPLPTAQLDRFLMCLSIGYPNREAEESILNQYTTQVNNQPLQEVVSIQEILTAQQELATIQVSNEVRGYILDLVQATRDSQNIELGISTRGAIAIMRASQGMAGVKGRTYVIPEDVVSIFEDVVAHRIVLKDSIINNTHEVTKQILHSVSVPK